MISFRVAAGRAYAWLVMFPVFAGVALITLAGIFRMLDWTILVGAVTVLVVIIQIITAVLAFMPKTAGTVAFLGGVLGLIVPGWKAVDSSAAFLKAYVKALGFYGAFLGLGVMAVNILPLENHPGAFVAISLGVLTLGYMAMAGILPVEKTDWGKKAALVVTAFIAVNIALTLPGVRDGTLWDVAIGADNTHPGTETRKALRELNELARKQVDEADAARLREIARRRKENKNYVPSAEEATFVAEVSKSAHWATRHARWWEFALENPREQGVHIALVIAIYTLIAIAAWTLIKKFFSLLSGKKAKA